MKTRALLVLVTPAVVACATAAVAQALPPPLYGPPPVYAERTYPAAPPAYPAEVLPDGDTLLPQEVVGILRSTGFSPLAAPARLGRFYVVAVVDPNGAKGRVTMDALTGRLVRFAPIDRRDDLVGASNPSARLMPAPPPHGLRPPAPLPNVPSRVTAAAPPLPVARPDAAGLAAKSGTTAPKDATETVAENRRPDGKPVATAPVATSRVLATPGGPKLLPTPAMPPVQTLE